ncbi:hypothetical protein MKD33_03000, partial [Chromobacterium piscinae]
LLLTVV